MIVGNISVNIFSIVIEPLCELGEAKDGVVVIETNPIISIIPSKNIEIVFFVHFKLSFIKYI